jgi:hypothetical protein
MKNILIISITFLCFGCYSQSYKETVIETINAEIRITKMGSDGRKTIIEAVGVYYGETVKIYHSGFDGYYREYNLGEGMVIKSEVTFIKQVINNKTRIIGKTSYSYFLAPGD